MKFFRSHLVKTWVTGTLPIYVLLGLTACGSQPEILTAVETETVEAETPVYKPLPKDQFRDHYTDSGFKDTGPLRINDVSRYVEELWAVIKLYRGDKQSLREVYGVDSEGNPINDNTEGEQD